MFNLFLLTCLNFFWFFCILQIGYTNLFKGKGGFYDKRNVETYGHNEASDLTEPEEAKKVE
jgi:hypothetical protein